MQSKISGVGKYVPPRVVKNQELEALMNTSDEWIRQRTGIEERRWAEPGTSTSSMAFEAAKEALIDAGKTADDVDCIVFATVSPDFCFPGCGVILQKLLTPNRTIPAIDIRNQCAGFLYSLSVADAWIKTGVYKCILVVGSEVHSTGLNKTPAGRDISVLFGDGAGAVVVEPTHNANEGIILTKLHSEGQNAEKLWCHRPSSADYPRLNINEQIIDESFYPHMDGKFVFKNAVTRMCEVLAEACAEAKINLKDIDFVIAHQANLRINQMVMQQLEMPPEKTINTLQKYGNTTAGTIPITMEEAQTHKLLKKGDLVALVAFGSGFTWGATLLRWAK
ncbi:MAG: beta-ketoacyl-ACP synthase III [Oligoflexia bacterium]|nr:beta-ketoacyl-ACP synthase III [Oligoflexia bacterium]